MDFNGVFDFQLFLYEQLGWPNDDVNKWKVKKPEIQFSFLDKLRENDLSKRLCIDIGNTAAGSFDSIEYKNDQLSIFTGGDSDVEGFQKLSMMPEKLEIIVDRDPRLSYLALNPEFHMEIDGFPQSKKKCALIYPHGSLLMTKKYRANVLANHGLGEECFEDTPIPDDFSLGYLKAIVARMHSNVLPRLRRHYGSKVSTYGMSIERASPEEFSNGKIRTTGDEVVIAFYMDVSKKMKNADIEHWMEKFFISELPFNVYAYCERMAAERLSVRLLANIPE